MPDYWTDLRSERNAEQFLRRPGLTWAVAQSPLQGSDNSQIARLFLTNHFLCTGSDRPKAAESGSIAACNVASFERDAFEKIPLFELFSDTAEVPNMMGDDNQLNLL
jgi:hypothetical protein